MKRFICLFGVFSLGLSKLFGGDVSDGEKLFALKVKPLLAQKCMACHGDDPKKI